MSHSMDSKSAMAALIDPMNEPEPSAADGPGGSGFGSTFAPASAINGNAAPPPTSPTGSNNPYRTASTKSATPSRLTKQSPSVKHSPPTKTGATTSVRSSSGSPRAEQFPNYRAEAFADFAPTSNSRRRAESHGTPPTYQEATSTASSQDLTGRPRRGSSLKERYPGDKSNQPLDIIRRDSRKAYRSHHLHKRSLPGADSIDRLDPAIGGRAYHHEGPYDAALLARNRDPKSGPLYALEDSNQEALKATPRENIQDAVERHKPLDGVAIVPPGQTDRFGRRYDYQEGADLMHEASSGDPGYKRWTGKDYDPEDLKGQSNPTFDLDRALRTHNISESNPNSFELQDRSRVSKDYHDAERDGTLDRRDPVDIAGDESKYADLEIANIRASADLTSSSDAAGMKRGGIGGSLKKRIGSLKKKVTED